MTVFNGLTTAHVLSARDQAAAAIERFEQVERSIPEEYYDRPELVALGHDLVRRRAVLTLLETELLLRHNSDLKLASAA